MVSLTPKVLANFSLKRKLMSLSQGQELGQLADLAFNWLFSVHSCVANQEPACLLTQLLTMTTTNKFPSLLFMVRSEILPDSVFWLSSTEYLNGDFMGWKKKQKKTTFYMIIKISKYVSFCRYNTFTYFQVEHFFLLLQ